MNNLVPNPDSSAMSERSARSSWLRRTLRLSQQEAVASATMTATGDNFFNAFAIHLQASAMQMGALTAVPQLFGAWMQLLSIWIGARLPRKQLVAAGSGIPGCRGGSHRLDRDTEFKPTHRVADRVGRCLQCCPEPDPAPLARLDGQHRATRAAAALFFQSEPVSPWCPPC